jgi:presenilin 1
MMLSSMSLLGVMGGVLALNVLENFSIPCDAFIFYGGCYNFAVVGVIAIFYKRGVPTLVTQAYLVFTAVLMAWQLSKFEEWTGWTLLVTLAFYDLCAVLTPCGPLKALVNLMQDYQEPMPGLLFEAELDNKEQQKHQQQWKQQQRSSSSRSNSSNSFSSGSSGKGGSGGGGGGGGGKQEMTSYSTSGGSDSSGSAVRNDQDLLHSYQHEKLDMYHNESFMNDGYADAYENEKISGAGHDDNDDESDDDINKSIKLGLGDFVFYGVLVSRAAQRGFTSGVICYLVVVLGLGATLVLLSVYRVALPALPISICLGVIFYMLSVFVITPFLEEVSSVPLYF